MLQVKIDNKKFEVKLDAVREEELFKDIVKMLMEEGQPVPTIASIESWMLKKASKSGLSDKVKEIKKELLADFNKRPIEPIKNTEPETTKTTEHKTTPPPAWDEVEVEKPNRLVFAKCPKCGRQHHVYFNKNRITCLCGTDINFKDSELTDGEYECPHCKKGTGRFKVLGTLDSVSCKECKGGIMLHYDWKRDIYTNKQ